MISTFKRNLVLGYTVSLLLLIISSLASYVSIRGLLNSSVKVRHTHTVIRELDAVISFMKDVETGQRGYLITGNEIFLEPYNGSTEKLIAAITRIKNLTSDNPAQQKDILILQNVAEKRFLKLEEFVAQKKLNVALASFDIMEGKKLMDEAKRLAGIMVDREQALLSTRTEQLDKFAAATPLLILVASILAILVTLFSFYKVNKDFQKEEKLQKDLQQKEDDISRRLTIIQELADKIAGGDYKIRVDDERKDVLGGLAFTLDKMADSLDHSFKDLAQREWLQSTIAALNGEIVVEKTMREFSSGIISLVAERTNSQSAAFYLFNNEGLLQLHSSYAMAADRKNTFKLNEGLVGQSAAAAKIIEVHGISQQDYTISFVAGELKPTSIIAVPLLYNHEVRGVIELASIYDYSPLHRAFLEAVSSNTGIAINTAESRQKVQQLLEETQAQSAALQTQQSELENINAELEVQAEKLQASEEELRVQQEELQQANGELEERSRLLEEKNQEIVERNQEIQAKSEALEISTKYKSEFLANMSHELRTPLNSILLLSRLLSENHESNLSDDQIEYARVIQGSGSGLLTLIDEILDLSKIESGKMELEFEDVPLREVLNEMKSLFAPVAQEKKLVFEMNLSQQLPKFIETDRLRLEQILRNLISNALKFTSNGSVLVDVIKSKFAVSFTVTDTGIGIPKQKQQSIFEAFQQADGSTRRKYGGTGLGLSISRELTKLLGGEILIVSEEGKGSSFTLSIPLQKSMALQARKYFPAAQNKQLSIEQDKEIPLIKDSRYISKVIPDSLPDDRDNIKKGDKTILIIEDDTAFARSLLDFTRQRHYKGIVAVRGDEGIELANRFLPLGILLDIQLPVKSGWEVMEELKNNPATRLIPVHMMSSHHLRSKSLSQGAIDFINKPVAFEKMGEIFQTIEDALSRHPRKVMIVEESLKHAQALAYFLEGFNVHAEIKSNVADGIKALGNNKVECVILDMGIPAQEAYNTLEEVKQTPGLENLPIIIFTGKNLSHTDEMRIKQYADSIVVKTAHSYQRILDEVSLFLHLMEKNKGEKLSVTYKQAGSLGEVLKNKTVLIADDDVRNIFSLTRTLEYHGMKVLSAMDGKEALKQLEENSKVDIVLMDMMMPEMDGYEATKSIRDINKFRTLPVIAITAKAMTGDREKCIQAGASDYITKPVDIDQLTSLLRVWLYDKA